MQSNRSGKPPLRLRLRLERMFTTDQFTYTDLRRMLVPLMLDQLFIFLIGMLSTAMVSSSGEAAISAVSMVGSLGYIATSLFSALSTGGSILVARAKGSGDAEQVRVVVGQTLLLATLVAAATCAVFVGFSGPLVQLLYPMAEPLLIEYAIEYLTLMSFSYLPFALYMAISGVFRGLGDSRSNLVLTITINTVHLLLSFLLINVLDMGVTGSGLSYLYARIIGAAVAVVWIFRVRNDIRLRPRHVFRFVRKVQGAIVRLGIPLAVEQILFQVGLVLTQVFIATLPTATIAANGIANSAFGLLNAVGFALTTIVTTVCGQCIGARRGDLAAHYVRSFISAGRFILLIAVVIIGPLMPLILRLYAPSEQALPQIYLALAIGMLPMPLLWCDANLPGAALRAAGDATYVTGVSLVSMWVARVAVGYLLTITLGLGIAGVWISLVVEWVLRAVLLRPRIRGDRWLRRAIPD